MFVGSSVDAAIVSLRLRRHRIARHLRIFSHSSPAERLELFHIVKLLPPRARALEIGSHVGSSALFICAGLNHVGGHLVCVDTWMNQTMSDGTKDTYDEFLSNTRPYAHMITSVRKFSCDLTEADVGEHLDF